MKRKKFGHSGWWVAVIWAAVLGMFLALAYAEYAASAPAVPEGAHLLDTSPITVCDDGMPVLRYVYQGLDGGTTLVYKQPNQPARIVMHFKAGPGQGGEPYEVWDGAELITLDQLRSRYDDPCDAFVKA